jgi:hypothetical protein
MTSELSAGGCRTVSDIHAVGHRAFAPPSSGQESLKSGPRNNRGELRP